MQYVVVVVVVEIIHQPIEDVGVLLINSPRPKALQVPRVCKLITLLDLRQRDDEVLRVHFGRVAILDWWR